MYAPCKVTGSGGYGPFMSLRSMGLEALIGDEVGLRNFAELVWGKLAGKGSKKVQERLARRIPRPNAGDPSLDRGDWLTKPRSDGPGRVVEGVVLGGELVEGLPGDLEMMLTGVLKVEPAAGTLVPRGAAHSRRPPRGRRATALPLSCAVRPSDVLCGLRQAPEPPAAPEALVGGLATPPNG